ncbi:MAG: nuclear transport factor 2 family protein [Pseudomonadota bacterium]|nr:nuclear transport factor 2 family protein [Pseudomonadota bacterium]
MTDILPVIETLENRWMRAWVSGDARTLKQLTARNFRLVMGSKPCAILDAKSWLEAATTSFLCEAYRFGDVYARDLGPVTVFATQLELKASIDGHDWSGRMWVTDIWKKSGVRRSWRMVERVFSRPEEDKQVPAAIRSLQLWQRPPKR